MGIAAQCLHGARVCVIPHTTNEFRPYALRHRVLGVVSALLIVSKGLALGLVGLMPLPAELSTITTARVVQLTNLERTNAGLQALQVNDALTQAAQQKAQNMLEQDYFAHISPSGVTPWFWISKVNYDYQLAGENLAIDFVEVENVVAAWMASPTHRENLMHSDYVETGVAVASGEFEGATSTIVVHMFGLPAKQPVRAPNEEITPKKITTEIKPEVLAAVPDIVPNASVPSLTVKQSGGVVQDKLALAVIGDAGLLTAILINNQERVVVTLSDSGVAEPIVNVSDIPDGELVIRAYTQDDAGKPSELSKPQIVVKDTLGPPIANEQLSFIVSPNTDVPQALIDLGKSEFSDLIIEGDGVKIKDSIVPLTDNVLRVAALDEFGNSTALGDVTLLPSFFTEGNVSYLNTPARFSQVVRRTTMVVGLIILALLTLAVVIRIQVQHPRMIVHALFVFGLASILLFL